MAGAGVAGGVVILAGVAGVAGIHIPLVDILTRYERYLLIILM